jgi:hypothetical protein
MSGPHAFAVRLKRFRQKRIRVHRSPPRVDDVAQRPSFGSGWQIIRLIGISEKQKYFYKGDWTAQISLIRLNKFDFKRKSGKPSS